ncbi:DoxX family protein [Actinokineospora sp. PR83]|uniref:DoxX family protein n=1 Tax=Actinokineospora sp. PR83 TaxID=2884908 RepID=UPI001F46E79C|nr:DoxX family protein [Actinokineospora sp. PR83]MCG8920180.1 DoxX family protein [Actinokineospora sp. PR83]
MTTTATRPAGRSTNTTATRVGYALSGVAVVFLLFDAVIHLLVLPQVAEAAGQLGFPVSTMPVIGALELVCLVLYVVPRTSVLGAILLTAFLGGAMSAQVRVGAPLLSTVLFSAYVAVVVWAGLYLRNAALRSAIGVVRG